MRIMYNNIYTYIHAKHRRDEAQKKNELKKTFPQNKPRYKFVSFDNFFKLLKQFTQIEMTNKTMLTILVVNKKKKISFVFETVGVAISFHYVLH